MKIILYLVVNKDTYKVCNGKGLKRVKYKIFYNELSLLDFVYIYIYVHTVECKSWSEARDEYYSIIDINITTCVCTNQ